MAFIRPGRRTRLQRRMAATLDGPSCQIERQGTVKTSVGQVPGAWSVVATASRCSVGPVGGSPSERAIADKVQGEETATISLPAGTPVKRGDRLTVAGQVWMVAGVIAGHTNELVARAICSRPTRTPA